MRKEQNHDGSYTLAIGNSKRSPNAKFVSFTFAGRQLTGPEGLPVALALGLEGILSFSQHDCPQPRGVYCGIGHCYECRVTIDGVPHLRSCLVLLKKDMVVEPEDCQDYRHSEGPPPWK